MKLLIIALALAVALYSCSKDSAPTLAKLSTVAILKTNRNYVVVSASLPNDGNSAVSERGFCWSATVVKPTIDSSSHLKLSAFNTTDTIKGLSYGTKYYIRSYAINSIGISYSQLDSFATEQSQYTYGQSFQGGVVFYIDSTGEHGLIASKTPGHCYWTWWEDGMKWVYVGTSTEIGTGQANTNAIVAAGNTNPQTAAQYCQNFSAEGYDDWFLPSYNELQALRNNLSWNALNAYPGDIYWSSSELGPTNPSDVWFVVINGGADFHWEGKDNDHGVIPVRKF